MNTIMPHTSEIAGLAFAGTRRATPLAMDSTDGQASDTTVQALAFEHDAEATVNVYVNDGLALELKPTEARTLAAMLSLSAGEIDGHGPNVPTVLHAAA